MAAVDVDELELARRELGLSVADLWSRYFALGGMSPALELEAILSERSLQTPTTATCWLSPSTNASPSSAVIIR